MPPLAAALIGAAAMRLRLKRTALGKAAGGDAASSGTQGSCFAVAPPESMAGIRRCGPPAGLCGMSLAPLRGSLLRWVPGRIPLSLHAPGKAVERAAPKPSTALSPEACNVAERSERLSGTQRKTRREAAPNAFRASLAKREGVRSVGLSASAARH